MRDLVYRYMGEQEAIRRHVLTADAVSQDFDGLRKLTVSSCLLKPTVRFVHHISLNEVLHPQNMH